MRRHIPAAPVQKTQDIDTPYLESAFPLLCPACSRHSCSRRASASCLAELDLATVQTSAGQALRSGRKHGWTHSSVQLHVSRCLCLLEPARVWNRLLQFHLLLATGCCALRALAEKVSVSPVLDLYLCGALVARRPRSTRHLREREGKRASSHACRCRCRCCCTSTTRKTFAALKTNEQARRNRNDTFALIDDRA